MSPRLTFIYFLLLTFIPSANAGVWVQTGNMLTEQGDASTSGTHWVDSSTVGYAFPQGFILGLNTLYRRDSSTGDNTFAWGFKGGLLIKGFELSGSYLPSAHDSTGGVSQTGSGYAVNVGYTYFFSKKIGLGLYGLYWNNTFDLPAGQTGTKPAHHETTPLLNLTYQF